MLILVIKQVFSDKLSKLVRKQFIFRVFVSVITKRQGNKNAKKDHKKT